MVVEGNEGKKKKAIKKEIKEKKTECQETTV